MSSLCDYSDAYRLVKGTIMIAPVPSLAANPNNNDKEMLFKNCSHLRLHKWINNTQRDNDKYIHVIMPMYNFIECITTYSKTSGSLWQYYRDEPAWTDTSATASIHAANNSAAFTFKQKIAGKADDGGTKDVEILVILKYLSNFWRTLEIPLINW